MSNSKRILKFPVPLFDGDFEVPSRFRPIHVNWDPHAPDKDPMMWAECIDDSQLTKPRITYHWAAIGEPIGPELKYVGTIMQFQEFVWHLYWRVSVQSRVIDATT